jgi:RNA polymerase primary sigma factor
MESTRIRKKKQSKYMSKTSPQTEFESLKEKLKSALDTLAPREREVLKMRFGLEDEWPLTVNEVSLYFNCSESDVRQIETRALRRLRHSRARNESG